MFTPLMATAVATPDDLFTALLESAPHDCRRRGRRLVRRGGGMRFAFYGRISTDGY
jgi:hypothetical protein